jgi:hypothetical protein
MLFLIINKKNNSTENFASNAWTTNKEQLAAESAGLTDTQSTQVKNMIDSITQTQLKNLISTQSPLLTGPAGPPGIQGPAGTKLIASGRLVNKNGSYDDTVDSQNFFHPKYIVTRTEGTSPISSLSFMDTVSPFVSFQNWQLDIDNNLRNRYDDKCLTMNPTQDKLYMDTCSDNPNQKWSWDNSNRIYSTTASSNTILKCIGLTKPEHNVLTTNIPGCNGKDCMSNTARRFLTVKDCPKNNINDDEMWSFV